MTVKLVGSSSGSVSLQAPASTTGGANLEFKLPVADGSSGQFMKTDGSGALSFATVTSVVKEQFFQPCDGSTISTSNGNITLTNVTSTQGLSSSNATLTGSEISYQPPTGTTCVIYEFKTGFAPGDSNGIWNTALFIDGQIIDYSGRSARTTSTNGTSLLDFKFGIMIGGSTNNSTGRQASWTSAKTLLLKVRDYDSNHDMVAHKRSYYQMGGGGFFMPQIGITAIG